MTPSNDAVIASQEAQADSRVPERAISAIRTRAIGAVEKANAGHAGAPTGLAPLGCMLWDRYAGPLGAIIGMHTFGASASIEVEAAKAQFARSGTP